MRAEQASEASGIGGGEPRGVPATAAPAVSAIEHMAFDSGDWPSEDRLARYSRFNGSPIVVREDGPGFAMRVSRWRFDQMVLHERRANAVIHERSPREVADGLDHVIAHLVVSGDYEADDGRGFRSVSPGAILLLDMQRPMRTRAHSSHVVTVSIAREIARATLGNLAKVHGTILSGSHVLPLADFLLSLCRRARQLPRSAAVPLAQAIAPLLAAAADAVPATEDGALSPRGAFDRARLIVDRHLDDPGFSPDMLVKMSGLSRTTIYRLFQPHGGLMVFVANRRLESARLMIADPHDRRSLAEIAAACGFATEGYFARKFTAAYGLGPGPYRKRLGASSGDQPDPRLSLWLSELS